MASQVITKTITYTPDASYAFDVTTGGFRVQAGGFTVTGNSTLTGTLGGLTGLTVASGGATITAGGLTITAGGQTITAGNFAMGGGQAAMKYYNAGDTGTSLTIDWNNGNAQRVRMTGNCTFTFSNPVAGSHYRLEVLQDGTGSRLATWPGTVAWDNGTAPTLTTTINKKDTFDYWYNGGAYIGTTHSANVADTT